MSKLSIMIKYSLQRRHIIALCIASVYIFLGVREIISDVWGMLLYVLFCLLLIFANRKASRFTGRVGILRKTVIDGKSPPILVECMGWIFLLGPAVLYLFKILSNI